MRYVIFNAQGAAELRQDSAPELPEGAIALTEEQVALVMSGDWMIGGDGALVPAPPPVAINAVPQVVSKFQAKAALRGAGLLSQVETLMADPAADPLAVLAWTDAQEFRRTSPTVLSMGAALGLDDAALDALFTTAAGIEA